MGDTKTLNIDELIKKQIEELLAEKKAAQEEKEPDLSAVVKAELEKILSEKQVEQSAGVLDTIAGMEIAGIPLGAAAAGAAVAAVGDIVGGLVKGFAPTFPNWVVPAIGAWVVGTGTVKRFVGVRAAEVAQLLLAYDAVQQFLDIRGRIAGLLGGITGQFTAGSTSGSQVAGAPETIDQYLAMKG